MYIYIVVLTMGLMPLFSILAEATVIGSHAGMLHLVGKWFAFWAVGVRLFLAGLRQSIQPRYTAEAIFGLGKELRSRSFRSLDSRICQFLSWD